LGLSTGKATSTELKCGYNEIIISIDGGILENEFLQQFLDLI
jgi:hypothetical protein